MSATSTPTTSGSSRAVALGMITIMMMMILPIPTILLDILLAFSITVSLLIFLLAINYGDPVEFSTFPSVLLVVTMLRLSLNIASTRLILLHGHEGVDAAGNVIQAFGSFVVGGSYLVGIIVFVILVVINFKVITAGAGRISEVAARFTLDAMPGKQMAIDNDLANGHITEEVARKRRKAVADEADFYGAMDGANKFVKGDAVAGLIITAINIIGGMIIGIAQKGLSAADAAETYTILTIGDGLVSQIPALLVSTAAGLIASRTASEHGGLSESLLVQLLGRREPLLLSGVALAGLAIVPGMPTLAFALLSGGCFAMAQRLVRKPGAKPTPEAPADGTKSEEAETPLHDLLAVDLLALEVGFDLVPLVDRKRGGELIKRISSVRKQLVQELGIVVPPIHIRDNLALPASTYRLLLSGTSVGQADLRTAKVMAIDPGGATGNLKGEKTKDPAFGMPAVWIATSDRERAEVLGYTVVDAPTVAITHLTEILRRHAAELLGRREVQELLDAFSRTNAKLVEELVPTLLPLGDLIRVLKNLLREGVSIRDLRTILEAVADCAAREKDPDNLTELVRQRLFRALTARHADGTGTIHALLLDPTVEAAFRGRPLPGTNVPDPDVLGKLSTGIERALKKVVNSPSDPLLLTAPDIRSTVAALASRCAPGLAVMSFRELDPKATVRSLGVVTLAAQ